MNHSMSTKDYDVAVYIGRFQPFHLGHIGVVTEALKRADKVLILVGSANLARDTRNPFTFEERAGMIEACMGAMDEDIIVRPLDDSPYDKPDWINRVSVAARSVTKAVRPRICLIGNVRDQTSEYLGWFPAWDYVPVKDNGLNATAIRKAYFAGGVDFHQVGWQDGGVVWTEVCPDTTIQFLDSFRGRDTYRYLMDQRAAEVAYKEQWGEGPFQTVDPVIIKGDHILMIERGGSEGTGMFGLPGGFLNRYEDMLYGACREAIEETALFIAPRDMPEFLAYPAALKANPHLPLPKCMQDAIALLMSYQRGHGERFGDPNRSRRGHLITEAFLFVLPDGHGLPPVRGCDDAKQAFWTPISAIDPKNTFEDHAFIIDKMISLHA